MAGLAVEVHDGPVVQALKFIRAYWSLLLPAALICRFAYYRYTSPLRQYPGPWLASGSRAWKVWSTYNGKTETDHIELHEKYGMLFRDAYYCAPLSSYTRTHRPDRTKRAVILFSICCSRGTSCWQRIPQDGLLWCVSTSGKPRHLHGDK
jgi:hypothetical protein